GQAPFDDPAYVGVFDLKTNRRVDIIRLSRPSIQKLQITGPNCASIPNTCTELGIYTTTYTFNPSTYNSTKGYYFAYLRCCRNSIINNIINPGDAAIAIYMEVPPFPLRNSTPAFSNNPFTYLCVNNPFSYNLNFSDPDGDSVHYSLATPLNG